MDIDTKSLAINKLVQTCIDKNHSIIIGSSSPEKRLLELKEAFPNEIFKIVEHGVCRMKK